jgi:hypothetical protein
MVFVCSFGAVGTVDRTPETRRFSLAYAISGDSSNAGTNLARPEISGKL